ncbi:MAG TPA: hypothetical protein VGQ16_11850, partial [Vicinamibacterales bacterium]|nr:hypothetical protein [Vicinamibacterales bacterium]
QFAPPRTAALTLGRGSDELHSTEKVDRRLPARVARELRAPEISTEISSDAHAAAGLPLHVPMTNRGGFSHQ